MFNYLKKKQKASIIFNKKYYSIDVTNFIQASSTVLLILLFINYLFSIYF